MERQRQAAQPPQPAAPAPPPLPQQQPPAYQPPQQYAPPAPQPPAYYPPQQTQQAPPVQPPAQPQAQPPAQPQAQPPAQPQPTQSQGLPQYYYQPQAQPQYQPPPPQPQPAQAVYTIGAENHKKGMPAWLVAVLTIALVGGGLFGVYKVVSTRNGTSATATTAPDVLSGTASKSHPYAKYLEVSGIRLIEGSDKKPVVRFAVVNHSPAELAGLELRVTFRAVNAAAGAEPIAVVEAKVGSVPAHGIKDMEFPLKTSLKVYELPDWQFMKSNFEITAPN
ncbi:MAG: hypothetical protein HY821_05455 [Acidobacteria bacterium]|nr:hypothetical protein [Acidobacteriota bacterium]